jgi:hypothetical protein
MANQRGIPTLPSTLIRPTPTQTPPEQANGGQAEEQAEGDGQGRGAAPAEAKPRTRARRVIAGGGDAKGRKLSIPDAVFDRLQLTAIQRRKTISAVATEILDRNLPKLRIERDA